MPAPARDSGSRLEADIVIEGGDWDRIARAEDLVQDAVRAVGDNTEAAGSLTIALSTDAHVAELNGRFRGKSRPTNVLSFPAGPAAEDGALGDIVIAFETVAREATEQEVALKDHLQHLVVHGALHLLGYDHEQSSDAEHMEKTEIIILSTLGIANPYTGDLETGTNAASGFLPTKSHD